MKTVKLAELCTIKGGIPAPKKTTQNGTIPFVRMRELGEVHLSSEFSPNQEFLTETDERTFAKKIVQPGAVLFPRSGSVHLNHRACLKSRAAIVSHIGALIPKEGTVALFLYYLLTDYDMTKIMTQNTGMNMVRFGQLSDVEFKIPDSKPERTKIAEVLSTVDRAIGQTEALIAKQQSIKTGLMQDLITRGIDEYGNLRSEETHEFKDSPMGRIPVEWEVVTISSVLSRPPKNGYSPIESDQWNGEYMLGLGCLTPDGFEPTQLKYAPPSSPAHEDAMLFPGDFLISRSNTSSLVGLVGIFYDIGEPCIYADLMVRLSFKKNVSAKFMEYVFSSAIIRRQIESGAIGTSGSMVKINATMIKDITFAKPPLKEQERLLMQLQIQRCHIRGLRTAQTKLISLKTALMQDLLTGKRRVTSLLPKAEEAST